ncbi:uncharacterized protein LOC141854899 [Brevipalpus obovatus]|uniref:uncharacterized protein LOC141854899 n=1 Tax=Brevipalpus obovatus TaxID=246614 RepID=UPI003D9FAE87
MEVHSGNGTSGRRKNSEKRKEKSRFAARARRSRESEIFFDMSKLLPLPQSIVSQVDKASTMRLATSFIRTRHLTEKLTTIGNEKEQVTCEQTNILGPTGVMDAFLMVLTPDGHMPFISENVENYLGLKQIDLLGVSIFEFTHPCDHNDIRDALAHKYDLSSSLAKCGSNDTRQQATNSFLIRIKCTITSKGKTVNIKSAAYKVIKLTGYWLDCGESDRYLCLIGEPLVSANKIDGPVAGQTFLSHHSPDMKFTHIDERFTEILGYNQKDLIGQSIYNLLHAVDCLDLSKCFQTLFTKGQSETGYYRLLAKRGGYIWIQSQATLITDNHTQQPVSVVCVNYALSGIVDQDKIISEEQCREREKVDHQINLPTAVSVNGGDEDDQENDLVKLISAANFDCKNPKRTSPFSQLLPATSEQLTPVSLQTLDVAVPNERNLSPQNPDTDLPPVLTTRSVTQELFIPLSLSTPSSLTVNSTQQDPLIVSPCPVSADPQQPLLSTSVGPVITESLPTPATATIFTPRTADMNPGFLIPVGDDNEYGLTVLPDIEACNSDQDLTHLAPQAGDYCVPLEVASLSPFDNLSMDDILKEMGLIGNVGQGNVSCENNQLPSESETSNICSQDLGLTTTTKRIDVESALNNNDPFLSFTDGCLSTENFLTSNLSSNSSSNSPTFYNSSGLTDSPDFNLKCSSSSLCDSPPPSSCNSTLTSDLDICGSFATDEDDNNPHNMLGDSTKKALDDSFPLLPNEDFIWDSLMHSNIGDLVDDCADNIMSDDKSLDDLLNQDTSSSTHSSNGSSSPLNSNLAMLLQKDSHIKPANLPTMMAGKGNFYSKKNQSRGRIPSTCTSSFTAVSRTSSSDNRTNSNFYLVQNNRAGKGGINGRVDTISARSASHMRSSSGGNAKNSRNVSHGPQETARQMKYADESDGVRKYRNSGNTVYSKFGNNCVKIAQKLSNFNSSAVPSSKRAYLPSKNSSENNYKRMKLPSTLPTMQESSVLMNLLVNGEDVSNGYSRFQTSHMKSGRVNVG